MAIRFNLLQVCPFVPSFVFAVLFISPFNVLLCFLFISLSLVAVHNVYQNCDKFRERAPLKLNARN